MQLDRRGIEELQRERADGGRIAIQAPADRPAGIVEHGVLEGRAALADARHLGDDLGEVALADPREVHGKAGDVLDPIAVRVGVLQPGDDLVRHPGQHCLEVRVGPPVRRVSLDLREQRAGDVRVPRDHHRVTCGSNW
jgi:hypothetical protein